MTKQDIYDWMDKQIQADMLQNEVPNEEDKFYICNASADLHKSVHVYGIDNLCKELNEPYSIEEHSMGVDRHYIVYKDYKFFGLAERNKEHEGQ